MISTPSSPLPEARRSRRRGLLTGVALGAVAASLVGGGLALASVPSAAGTVTACVKKAGGAVRIIDPATGARCGRGETRVAWTTMTPRGAWASSTAYRGGDVVTRDGSTWLARKASKGVVPTAGASWALLAWSGAVGE